jgi:hypothetical protein
MLVSPVPVEQDLMSTSKTPVVTVPLAARAAEL